MSSQVKGEIVSGNALRDEPQHALLADPERRADPLDPPFVDELHQRVPAHRLDHLAHLPERVVHCRQRLESLTWRQPLKPGVEPFPERVHVFDELLVRQCAPRELGVTVCLQLSQSQPTHVHPAWFRAFELVDGIVLLRRAG